MRQTRTSNNCSAEHPGNDCWSELLDATLPEVWFGTPEGYMWVNGPKDKVRPDAIWPEAWR